MEFIDGAVGSGCLFRCLRERSMRSHSRLLDINRRVLLATLALLPAFPGTLLPTSASAQTAGSPLPSWNDGAAKKAIVDFVRATSDRSSPSYVPPEDRVATFDQ